MADVQPNYLVEQQRLKAQIAQLRAQIEGQRLAILEMADRKAKHVENIEASERTIADYEGKLAALAETHGPLNKATYEALKASL